MARADSSSKALIKAAIRSTCHKIAQRYPDQNLDRLHGSNGKWLVLCDELFEEVCCDFTVRKLDLGLVEKRAVFDAEWVSQVTYELVTKPARPRRRNAQRATACTHLSGSSSVEPTSNTGTFTGSATIVKPATQGAGMALLGTTSAVSSATHTVRSSPVVEDMSTRKPEPLADTLMPDDMKLESATPAPTWFGTVLN